MSDACKAPSEWRDGTSTSRYPLGATTLIPALAAGRAFRRDPLAFLVKRGQGAPVFRFKTSFTEYVLINDPALIRRVLLDDASSFGEGKWTQRGFYVMGDCLITREGAPHRERRSQIQPAFARPEFEAALPAMVETAERLDARWTDGRVLRLQPEMAHAALVASARSLFEEDLEAEADELCAALRVMLWAISRLPIPRPQLVSARARLRKAARRLARSEFAEKLREVGADETAVIDEIVSLLIASVDTTPGTLTWFWYELARNPQVETRLHAELADVLGGRTPTVDDIAHLVFMKHVISETLRLHPPVHFIDRRALKDVQLGDITTVRAGEYILLSPLLTQRDARFHDEPDSFLPERWEVELVDPIRRFTYFPFGAGPHVCIGMGLAVQEISLFVAILAQRWRLRATDSREPGLYPSQLQMRVEARA
jgi:cytochrome P450